MKRVFIAINLPESVKKRLKQYQEKYDYLLARQSPAKRDGGGPVRWTKEPSLHLTLVFIGYVTDEQLVEICRAAREVAAKFEPFFINFKKIILGPPNKPPRMIWVEGEASKELSELKNQLEERLLNCNSGFNHQEKRLLRPHITLARIKMEQWRQMESKPVVEENFEAQVPVASIEVMESDLKRDGAEYAVLELCALG
ncbi:MAG: 2'-5' RNA ligase [Parcubacteria group bacterium LiPW_39]|nr:MAG: 2'-5' RNA ligase [Parcubacteria group bacterium LiPW_39]